MSRLILVFVILTFSSRLSAQSYKDSIEAQFLRYTNLLINKEFAKSTDYMNQEFFKIFSKAQMIALIEKTYNNPEINFSIDNPVVISVGNSKMINKTNYVKLQYSNYMNIRFKSDEKETPDTASTKMALQAQFGEDNVKYIQSTDTYRIFVVKNVIADSKDMRNWTFVVVEDKQKPILEKFIPKELL